MVKRILAGAAVLVLCGALARGGELFDVRVEAGLEIGHQGAELIDGELDYDTTVFLPYLQVSRFGNGICVSGRIRGLFAVDEDTEVDDIEYETQTSGFDIQGLVGWGFAVGPVKLAPVVGLAFREVSTQSDPDEDYGNLDYDYDALFLELGAHAEISLGRVRVVAQVTVGPVITGETEIDYGAYDADDSADIGFFEGYHLELRGGIDYKFNDLVALHLGLAYERFADETDEFEEFDETSEDELDRVVFNFGVVVTF
jgi:hypothetical protein